MPTPGLLVATVAYVITCSLNLYIGERARVQHQIAVYSIQQVIGPAVGFLIGLVMIKLLGRIPSGRLPVMPSRSSSRH